MASGSDALYGQAADSEAVDSRIADELYRRTPILIAIIASLTAIYWWALRGRIDTLALNAWVLAMAVALLVRVLLWQARERFLSRLRGSTWVRLFAAASTLMGLAWSGIFFTVDDWTRLDLIAPAWMIVLGVTSAAIAVMWQHFPTFVLYTLPMGVAGGYQLVTKGVAELQWLSWSLLIYFLVVTYFTRQTNLLYLARIRLELTNADLVERLEQQAEEREAVIHERTAALDENREYLEHMANHDPLTGLPNRHRFLQTVNHCVGAPGSEGFALLFIDLDHFKDINDSLGHTVGDALLKAVSER
ncbi:MAG: GGDEF domain-containing protein, partial [Halieaceae bacterium]|nr:GGDEF domain-containing protein [Halieaceae bacterium]